MSSPTSRPASTEGMKTSDDSQTTVEAPATAEYCGPEGSKTISTVTLPVGQSSLPTLDRTESLATIPYTNVMPPTVLSPPAVLSPPSVHSSTTALGPSGLGSLTDPQHTIPSALAPPLHGPEARLDGMYRPRAPHMRPVSAIKSGSAIKSVKSNGRSERGMVEPTNS